MTFISAHRRQRQGNLCETEASLVCRVSSRPARATQRPWREEEEKGEGRRRRSRRRERKQRKSAGGHQPTGPLRNLEVVEVPHPQLGERDQKAPARVPQTSLPGRELSGTREVQLGTKKGFYFHSMSVWPSGLAQLLCPQF